MQDAEAEKKRADARIKKENEEKAERKAEEKNQIKREAKAKKDANYVNNLLSSTMVELERATNTYLTDNEADYKTRGAQLLLEEVRDLVDKANQNIMGVGVWEDWDMARIKDLKGDMLSKTRTG